MPAYLHQWPKYCGCLQQVDNSQSFACNQHQHAWEPSQPTGTGTHQKDSTVQAMAINRFHCLNNHSCRVCCCAYMVVLPQQSHGTSISCSVLLSDFNKTGSLWIQAWTSSALLIAIHSSKDILVRVYAASTLPGSVVSITGYSVYQLQGPEAIYPGSFYCMLHCCQQADSLYNCFPYPMNLMPSNASTTLGLVMSASVSKPS